MEVDHSSACWCHWDMAVVALEHRCVVVVAKKLRDFELPVARLCSSGMESGRGTPLDLAANCYLGNLETVHRSHVEIVTSASTGQGYWMVADSRHLYHE